MTVLLDMPESPANRKLGMFMSCLQLKSATGEVVREMCKSSMLQYRSWLLRQIETVVFAPFLLTGHTSEKQMIRYVGTDGLIELSEYNLIFISSFQDRILRRLFRQPVTPRGAYQLSGPLAVR